MDIFSLSQLFALWREVAHIGVLTGLSLTALAGCAVALYLGWKIAIVRHLAILVIGAVVAGYGMGLYMHQVGRNEVLAQWADAKVAAALERKRLDAAIEMKIRGEYLAENATLARLAGDRQQQIADLERERDAHKNRADGYEHAMVNMASGNTCELSPDAFRLRNRPKRK